MGAYTEGRAARRDDLPRGANPYPEHTAFWRDGDAILRSLG